MIIPQLAEFVNFMAVSLIDIIINYINDQNIFEF